MREGGWETYTVYVHRVPVTLMDVERSDGYVVRVRKLFSLLKSAG